ncbi:hypothetical protein F5X97DRAFT_86765 [Nemania serpens]|nr:hypothetical protein F5X97DRAFT_86765 [Nemania serpens]
MDKGNPVKGSIFEQIRYRRPLAKTSVSHRRQAREIPLQPFDAARPEFQAVTSAPDPAVEIVKAPSSSRLAFLDPFDLFPASSSLVWAYSTLSAKVRE